MDWNLILTNGLLLWQIILLDIVLSGDNAIVIGAAAAGLTQQHRRLAIAIGMIGAIVLRIIFCFFTAKALTVTYLELIGGILLIWIAYKLLLDYFQSNDEAEHHEQAIDLPRAILTILVADVSMSLDNVLAVSAVSHGALWAIITGLVISIGILAVAADRISLLISKFNFLNLIGAGLIFFIAISMIGKSLLGLGVNLPILTKLFA